MLPHRLGIVLMDAHRKIVDRIQAHGVVVCKYTLTISEFCHKPSNPVGCGVVIVIFLCPNVLLTRKLDPEGLLFRWRGFAGIVPNRRKRITATITILAYTHISRMGSTTTYKTIRYRTAENPFQCTDRVTVRF